MQPSLSPPEFTISAVEQSPSFATLTWADGHESRFHYIWLRHSEHFPAFPDDAKDGREHRLAGMGSEAEPSFIDISASGALRVGWRDRDAPVEFDAQWLRQHCYSSSARSGRRHKPVVWDSRLRNSMPEASFPEIARDETARLAFYRSILDYGFCFVRDMPQDRGTVTDLGDLLGIARRSAYADEPGDERIENLQTDSDVKVSTRQAYFLGPHTDTCWRLSLTGLICFHCLEAHATGGETLLVDGFNVCNKLREASPDAFDILSRVKLNFRASVNNGDEWRSIGQVITCDNDGEVVGFRYGDRSIPPLDLPEDLIEPVYSALSALGDVLYDPANWITCKLQPGEGLALNNQRLLHGRTSFDPGAGPRHLQYCAVELDTFHNKYRHLARTSHHDDWDHVLDWGVC